jgi:hypothetical protein
MQVNPRCRIGLQIWSFSQGNLGKDLVGHASLYRNVAMCLMGAD